jgi:hypothetical protein
VKSVSALVFYAYLTRSHAYAAFPLVQTLQVNSISGFVFTSVANTRPAFCSLPVDVEGGEAASTKVVKKEVQEKVTEDLSVALKGMLVHKFLPKAVKTNEPEPSLDEQTKTLLDKLKRQDESSKKVLETVDKMIQEDIRAESRMLEDEAGEENLVVAPSLQKMEEEKKEALKQYLKNNPEFGRLYAAEKQVFKISLTCTHLMIFVLLVSSCCFSDCIIKHEIIGRT